MSTLRGIHRTFQYITCYSLSDLLEYLLLIWRRFNTSHVTLYPVVVCQRCSFLGFQYITCYSLSFHPDLQVHGLLVSIHHMLLFIKFPRLRIYGANFVSIHHMLLFISFLACASTALILFQYITCYSLSNRTDNIFPWLGWVSIHHMLLFITQRGLYRAEMLGFNTSHVTLYRG